jgi:hypothetical protein
MNLLEFRLLMSRSNFPLKDVCINFHKTGRRDPRDTAHPSLRTVPANDSNPEFGTALPVFHLSISKVDKERVPSQ